VREVVQVIVRFSNFNVGGRVKRIENRGREVDMIVATRVGLTVVLSVRPELSWLPRYPRF